MEDPQSNRRLGNSFEITFLGPAFLGSADGRTNHGLDFIGFHRFGVEAFSPIFSDRPINDRSAIEAFPRIEDQEEIREAFQLHKAPALRTLHLFPPKWRCKAVDGAEQFSLLALTLAFSMSYRGSLTAQNYLYVQPRTKMNGWMVAFAPAMSTTACLYRAWLRKLGPFPDYVQTDLQTLRLATGYRPHDSGHATHRKSQKGDDPPYAYAAKAILKSAPVVK